MKNLPTIFEVRDQEELKLVRKAFKKVFPEVRLLRAAKGVRSLQVVAYEGDVGSPKVQRAIAKAKEKVSKEASVPYGRVLPRLSEGFGERVVYGAPRR
jgi:hypothetical protein